MEGRRLHPLSSSVGSRHSWTLCPFAQERPGPSRSGSCIRSGGNREPCGPSLEKPSSGEGQCCRVSPWVCGCRGKVRGCGSLGKAGKGPGLESQTGGVGGGCWGRDKAGEVLASRGRWCRRNQARSPRGSLPAQRGVWKPEQDTATAGGGKAPARQTWLLRQDSDTRPSTVSGMSTQA